jgi:hypothetical protein
MHRRAVFLTSTLVGRYIMSDISTGTVNTRKSSHDFCSTNVEGETFMD